MARSGSFEPLQQSWVGLLRLTLDAMNQVEYFGEADRNATSYPGQYDLLAYVFVAKHYSNRSRGIERGPKCQGFEVQGKQAERTRQWQAGVHSLESEPTLDGGARM